jgi:toxin ParE1/3/4
MNVIFATEVWEEVDTACTYYENEVDGLGKAFVLTIYQSIDEIKKYPTASRIIKNPYRRFLIPRFPFGIIYRIEQDMLYITAVAHLRKRPFYWNDRSV